MKKSAFFNVKILARISGRKILKSFDSFLTEILTNSCKNFIWENYQTIHTSENYQTIHTSEDFNCFRENLSENYNSHWCEPRFNFFIIVIIIIIIVTIIIIIRIFRVVIDTIISD